MPETLPFKCAGFLAFSLCFVPVLGGLQRGLLESDLQNDIASDDSSRSFSLGSGCGWMPETLPFKCDVFIVFPCVLCAPVRELCSIVILPLRSLLVYCVLLCSLVLPCLPSCAPVFLLFLVLSWVPLCSF